MVSGTEDHHVSYRPAAVAAPEKLDWHNPNWDAWIRRWERYRSVSKLSEMPEDYQVNTLIYTLGGEVEELLSRLRLPQRDMHNYTSFIEQLTTYFKGKVNIVYERTRFFSRNQLRGEPVENFIKDLHNISSNCRFGHLNDDLIMTKIIQGIQDSRLSEDMQLKENLVLKQVEEQVRQAEAVQKQQAIIRGQTTDTSIGAVAKRQVAEKSPEDRKCWRCGEGSPEFTLPIGNLTTPVGREAILSCTVNNLGKYKVGWLKAEDQTVLTLHTRVVTHNSRISVTHDNDRTWRLHIRQIKESDRGCYMCQVNTSPMRKQVGCIDVNVPPDILYDDTSADMSIQEGENATLICKAAGHPEPRITWRREDGEPILLKRNRQDMFKIETFNGSMLHFWRLDRRQMGAFLCIASNDVPPAVSKRIILNVNFAPVISVPNQLLGAPHGTDVALKCLVEAFPNTINYWIKNGGEMLLDGPKHEIREKRISYQVEMTLIIKRFNHNDVGTYNCVSTNSLGKAEGTLRLYEIKINQHEPGPADDNQAAFLGELADSSRGEKSRSELKKSSANGDSRLTPSLVLLAVASLAVT